MEPSHENGTRKRDLLKASHDDRKEVITTDLAPHALEEKEQYFKRKPGLWLWSLE